MTSPVTTCSHCHATITATDAFCLSCGTATGAPILDMPMDPLNHLRVALKDRYTVERELGRGGMATVYLATDVRHERRVAIKVLHPELAASVGSDRFVREIRVAAKLQHPHILTLYDSGDADGLLYYVMPFVDGESLRDRLDREKMLPVEEALLLVIEVAEALGYAHNQGIVHRDIKPENILLANGHALVADFGIARAISAAESEHKLTQTGSAVGTPVYMSPEQAMGDEVGPTSDLYSLACVAFELLTGEPPFTGISARAIMARHTMEAPPSIRLVRETVPEEVEETILWALAKVAADRPKNAEAFIEALATPLAATGNRRSMLRSRMTTAPRLTGIRKAFVPLWRRPPVIAAAAVVVLLGAGAAWKLWGGGKARSTAAGADARSLAVLYFTDESPNHDLGYLADGLTDGLIDRLRDVRELRVVSSGGAAQFKGSTVPDDSIARALAVGSLVRGSIEPEGSDIKVSVRLIDGVSGDVLQRATFRRPAADPLTLADTLAVEVASLVRSQLGTEIQLREQREKASSPQAWVLVRRAARLRQQMDSLGRAGDTTGVARAWAQADSLLAQAEATDPRWVEPIIQRGTLAYRRSRMTSPTAAGPWIDIGVAHADRALAKDGREASALELRGNLRYWKYLIGLETDPARARTLLASAQADLEQATQINPSQAGAWASLSHLYYRVPGKTGVDINLAARKAMEEDAYLSNADVILSRLFLSSYDLAQFPQAQQWCHEGLRRFPANWRFTECRLMMLTTRDVTPDIAAAWRYADSMVALTDSAGKPFNERSARLSVAAVLARVPGRADSARHVAGRSLGDAEVDHSRDLALRAAFVYGLLADTSAALNQLKIYFNANPSQRQAFADDPGWWLKPIQDTPGFRQLVGTASH